MGQANSSEPQFQGFVFEQPKNVETQQQIPQRKVFKAAKKPTQTQKNVKSPEQASTPTNIDKISQSLELKNQGNEYIQKKLFKEAAECYTKAINLHNTDSIYFSNRAVAYKLLNRFTEAKQDALQAIKLDEMNSRAHFIYGTIILLEVQLNPEFNEQLIKQAHQGLKSLEKAYNYIKDNNDQQKSKLKVSINQNSGKGKRMVFLIAQEMDRRNVKGLTSVLKDIQNRQKKELDWIYLENKMKQKVLEDTPVPQHFSCIITFEIMDEPILVNTGQTYEKNSLFQQIVQNGCVDPITRAQITPQTARVNLQLLQGIQELKGKYGWIGIEHEDNYKTIKFD